jgi:hypothetical protein
VDFLDLTFLYIARTMSHFPDFNTQSRRQHNSDKQDIDEDVDEDSEEDCDAITTSRIEPVRFVSVSRKRPCSEMGTGTSSVSPTLSKTTRLNDNDGDDDVHPKSLCANDRTVENGCVDDEVVAAPPEEPHVRSEAMPPTSRNWVVTFVRDIPFMVKAFRMFKDVTDVVSLEFGPDADDPTSTSMLMIRHTDHSSLNAADIAMTGRFGPGHPVGESVEATVHVAPLLSLLTAARQSTMIVTMFEVWENDKRQIAFHVKEDVPPHSGGSGYGCTTIIDTCSPDSHHASIAGWEEDFLITVSSPVLKTFLGRAKSADAVEITLEIIVERNPIGDDPPREGIRLTANSIGQFLTEVFISVSTDNDAAVKKDVFEDGDSALVSNDDWKVGYKDNFSVAKLLQFLKIADRTNVEIQVRENFPMVMKIKMGLGCVLQLVQAPKV